MAEPESIAIGRLRWRVQIIYRMQTAQVTGTSIDEMPTSPEYLNADVQPVSSMTFWGMSGEQIDGPITHRIFMRWIDYITNGDAVMRSTYRRDGSVRTETFRVRRIKEVAGRKRFVILETEMEKSV